MSENYFRTLRNELLSKPNSLKLESRRTTIVPARALQPATETDPELRPLRQ